MTDTDRRAALPLTERELAALRNDLARSNGPDDDVGNAVFGGPEEAENMAARLIATLDARAALASVPDEGPTVLPLGAPNYADGSARPAVPAALDEWTERDVLAYLSEDDVMYDHPVSAAGVPMDPVLFVRWGAIEKLGPAVPAALPEGNDAYQQGWDAGYAVADNLHRAALVSAPDEGPTCASCLRRVSEVDAETGECRDCFARPAVPAALDVEPRPSQARIRRGRNANGIVQSWEEPIARPAVPAALDVERLADWFCMNYPHGDHPDTFLQPDHCDEGVQDARDIAAYIAALRSEEPDE